MMSNDKGEIAAAAAAEPATEPAAAAATEPATEITGAGAAPTDQNKTENKEKKETPSDNTPAPPNQAVEPTEEKADSTAEEKKSTAPKPKAPSGDGDNDNDAQKKKKKEEEDRPARGMEDLLNKQNKESFKDAKKAVAETDTAKSVHGVLNAAYNNASGATQTTGTALMSMGANTAKSAAAAVKDTVKTIRDQGKAPQENPAVPEPLQTATKNP